MKSYQNQILIWLSTYFDIPPDCWLLASSSQNKYSQTYIFQQNKCQFNPQKVFVKSLRAEVEEKNSRHYDNEKNALEVAARIGSVGNVRAPKVFGTNNLLKSIAMEYLPGESLFNFLWNHNQRYLFLKKTDKKLIYDLGRWLSIFHCATPPIKSEDAEFSKTLRYDVSLIEKRLSVLRAKRFLPLSLDFLDRASAQVKVLHNELMGMDLTPVLVKGDFSTANIIINDNHELFVLDFSTSRRSLPEDDMARFFTELINIDFLRSSSNSSKYILSDYKLESFLDGYNYQLNSAREIILSFYLLKHAIINLYMYAANMSGTAAKNKLLSLALIFKQRNLIVRINKALDRILS